MGELTVEKQYITHSRVNMIGTQNNMNVLLSGTAFDLAEDCGPYKIYEEKKNTLYYPDDYLKGILDVLQSEHSILIQGEQGSGKTILAFRLAEYMKEEGMITSAYYLKFPDKWNMIRQWIQSIRIQEKEPAKQEVHLWMIDNAHRIDNVAEEFPESSLWGADYCICCSRDLNKVLVEEDVYDSVTLSRKQVFKRNIDEKIFFQCVCRISGIGIGRRESDILYQYIGGNLAMLWYLEKNDGLQSFFRNQDKAQAIDFDKIRNTYFPLDKKDGITEKNNLDVLKMLFLSQIDFAIPSDMQLDVCGTVLKGFYSRNYNEELEFEHASLAELFFKSICQKKDYSYFFEKSLKWALKKLAKLKPKKEKITQINRFLQALFSYRFILNDNQAMREKLFCEKKLLDYLNEKAPFISCSTWKCILMEAAEDQKIKEIFINHVRAPHFVESLTNTCDYDFRFFQEYFILEDTKEMEARLLAESRNVMANIKENGNEVQFLLLLLSLTEESAADFLGNISSQDLTEILLANQDGLLSYALLYRMLEEKIQAMVNAMITMDGYVRILKSCGSITAFASLLVNMGEESGKDFFRLLDRQDLICGLLDNTIAGHYSIATLNISLRIMKINSPEILEAFERAVGIEGYKQLLESQGTIVILANLIRHSSVDMQIRLTEMIHADPKLVKKLILRTKESGSSIGTLHLVLGYLGAKFPETREAFEKAVGTEGYKQLLESQGTIPILARILYRSSKKMQKEMSEMLSNNSQFISRLVEKTAQEKKSIGMLNNDIRNLVKINYPCLQFEKNIGTDGYLKMFSECNANAVNILRIMACSCISDFLTDSMYANMDLWEASKGRIQENSLYLLSNFHMDLYYAKKCNNHKFFRFLQDSVLAEEWMQWFRQGAVLEEFIMILRNMPLSTAKKVSCILVAEYKEAIADFHTVALNRKQGKVKKKNVFNPETIRRAIKTIERYNPFLFQLLDKEYRVHVKNFV